MFLNRQLLLPTCILILGLFTLSACSSNDSDDDTTSDSDTTTEANTTTGASAATDTSTTTDSNATTGSDTAAEDSPASLRARAAINNGYYLSRRDDYGSDGVLLGGATYTLKASENLIEMRDLEDESIVDSVYRYDDIGNLTSISFLSYDDFLAPIGDEIGTVNFEQENGALQVIDVDYFVGAELDYQIVYTYDDEGRPLSSVRRFVGTDESEVQQFNYENGVLVSITGTDVELEGVTVTETIIRDEQGRVSRVETRYEPMNGVSTPNVVYIAPSDVVYSYDQNGNVSEMSILESDGAVGFREVYTYQAIQEPLFNLINFDIYFQQ